MERKKKKIVDDLVPEIFTDTDFKIDQIRTWQLLQFVDSIIPFRCHFRWQIKIKQ